MGDLDEIDLNKLPPHVRNKLAQLQLELSEGDLTERGFHKKRGQLLKQYASNQRPPSATATRHKSRRHKRTTRSESRYHSGWCLDVKTIRLFIQLFTEIRHEAVQQALSQWTKDDATGPKPMKRRPSIANGKSTKKASNTGTFQYSVFPVFTQQYNSFKNMSIIN